MKKIVMVLVLAAVIATGTAFADHPNGWGIGVTTGYNISAGSGLYSVGGFPIGASIHFPNLPVYWQVKMYLGWGMFGIGITGDYYFIDQTFAPDIGMGWFLGAGGFFDIEFFSWGLGTYMDVGARIPIGISWMINNSSFELFFDVAPSFGVGFWFGGTGFFASSSSVMFHWAIPIEVGFRYWF